jgi:hypothetical protein
VALVQTAYLAGTPTIKWYALYEQFYTWRVVMWDANDRLDADMQYAIRMVQTRYATIEQAAVMCGLEVAVLREQLSRLALRTQIVETEKAPPALQRHIPGTY